MYRDSVVKTGSASSVEESTSVVLEVS
jgi:hypothetical protein